MRDTKKKIDAQKSKVYAAERFVFDKEKMLEYKDMLALQARVNKIVQTKRFLEIANLPAPPEVELDNGAGKTRATFHRISYKRFLLKMPRFARVDWVILHELSHYLVYLQELRTGNKYQAHGREFCQGYLQLVRYFLGREMAGKLRESFRQHKVKYLPKRELSPEHKAKAIAQLQKLRAAAT